jgi:hypothetical protein
LPWTHGTDGVLAAAGKINSAEGALGDNSGIRAQKGPAKITDAFSKIPVDRADSFNIP